MPFPDAATFAAWDVDYVKLDGCYALPADMDHGYPEFGRQLNLTGRQMVYSCSWPVYQIYAGMQVGLTNRLFFRGRSFLVKIVLLLTSVDSHVGFGAGG